MSVLCFTKRFSLIRKGSQLEMPDWFLRESDFELGQKETDFQDIIPYATTWVSPKKVNQIPEVQLSGRKWGLFFSISCPLIHFQLCSWAHLWNTRLQSEWESVSAAPPCSHETNLSIDLIIHPSITVAVNTAHTCPFRRTELCTVVQSFSAIVTVPIH